MDLWPAIDIRHGRCVRLVRGDFGAETAYGDPARVASDYVAAGAERIHVVDLDGARTGEPVNRDLILGIACSVPALLQVGGGVRSADDASALLRGGVGRVVLGTAALESPELLAALAETWPGRIVVGLDHRRSRTGGADSSRLAVRGWLESSAVPLEVAFEALSDLDLAGVVVTDITRDGTGTGPDLDGLAVALAATPLPVIASGGVGTTADLRALAGLVASGRSLAGVVVGRALLSGAFSIAEAATACAAGAGGDLSAEPGE